MVGSYELELEDGSKVSCPRIFISAQSGAGMADLRAAISEQVSLSLLAVPPVHVYDERLDH